VGREELRGRCDRIFSARFAVIFWKAGAGRHVDLEVGGFVAVDGGEGAEEHAGNVGESGGAAWGDASAGEEFVEGREGVIVMPWGSWKSQASSMSSVEKFLESGGWEAEWRGHQEDFGIEDAGGALAALGGAVLAAFVDSRCVRRCGLHGRSFFGFF
jgi:hypothetical protein